MNQDAAVIAAKPHVKVRFFSLNSIVSFVNIMEEESARAEVVGQRIRMDASSILGLANLGFNQAYDLVLHESDQKKDKIIRRLTDYLVE